MRVCFAFAIFCLAVFSAHAANGFMPNVPLSMPLPESAHKQLHAQLPAFKAMKDQVERPILSPVSHTAAPILTHRRDANSCPLPADLRQTFLGAMQCSLNITFNPCACDWLAQCLADQLCSYQFTCFLCFQSPSSLQEPLRSTCPTFCPCNGPFNSLYTCPTAPPAGAVSNPEMQFPQAFGERWDTQQSWHYLVGRMIPVDKTKATLGFQVIIGRFTLIPGSSSFPGSVYVINFAVTDPNAPLDGSQGYYMYFGAPEGTFPPELNPISLTNDSFSITGFHPHMQYQFKSVTGIPGAKGTTYQLSVQGSDLITGKAMALSLLFQDTKGAVLHGNLGDNRKAYLPCSTSFYFSMTNLKLVPSPTNVVSVGSNVYPLAKGNFWYDREQSVGQLENYQKGAATCYGNRHDFVNPLSVVAGQQKVANVSGWLWVALVLPSSGIEATLFKMGERINPDVFDENLSYGTIAYNSDGHATPFSESVGPGDFDLVPLSFQTITSLVDGTSRVFPEKTRVTVKTDNVQIDAVCENVKHVATGQNIPQVMGVGPNRYHEGLATCTGEVRLFSNGQRSVCFTSQFDSFAYVERLQNVE